MRMGGIGGVGLPVVLGLFVLLGVNPLQRFSQGLTGDRFDRGHTFTAAPPDGYTPR